MLRVVRNDARRDASCSSIFLRYDGFGQVATPQGTTGAVHYYTGDQVGTIQMEFTGGGASLGGWPVWQGQFAPFGQELDDPSRTLNRYKFNGKERDAESGLDYFGARYYAGSIARWMSPDWTAAAVPVPYASLADPQTFNLYSFVANNPLRQGDPDGHMGLNNSQPEECFANTSGSGCSTQQQMQDAQKDAAAKAAQQQKTLPDNPSGLGDGWKDVTPQGGQNPKIPQRFRGPKGSEIEFDPANPDKSPKTWGGKNHWHEVGPDGKREDGHLAPGSAIPGPDGAPDARVQLPSARQIGIGIGGAAAGYLIYRGLRMLPSVVIPPLWPTIPLNAAIP